MEDPPNVKLFNKYGRYFAQCDEHDWRSQKYRAKIDAEEAGCIHNEREH